MPASADHFDFVIIGSGFGGSVSALRLSQKGYRVAVLEKGKRWRTEDFPKTNWELRKSLWMPRLGLHGIQALTLLRHVLVIHGVGVGGGSLVYANQLMTPDAAIFQKEGWGTGDWRAELAPHYAEARRMLGAVPCQGVGNADTILREVGLEFSGTDTFHQNDVGVFFGKPGVTVSDPYFGGKGPDRTGCTKCGACMIGCPIGAKNTLDKNYLYLAEQLGAQIIPETEAQLVRPHESGGYTVETRSWLNGRPQAREFRATNVVFSGGVLGTVDLLLKCKQAGTLPHLSDRLGDRTRTNSEAILGVESFDRTKDWNDHLAITSGIYPQPDTHVEIVRFNKGSDLLYSLATVLTDGGGRIPRWLRFLGNILRHPRTFLRGLWLPGRSARISMILVMQSTENYLQLVRSRLGLQSRLPHNGTRIPSYIPIAHDLTRKMAARMNGTAQGSWFEALMDAPSTAHMLGGCILGDTDADGVVDRRGRVFHYPGLFVADGSAVPVNLACNPSLTITALSEYFMEAVPSKDSSVR